MSEVNLLCFVTNVLVCIFCGAYFAIVPTLTRKAFLFGVKVPESAQQHPEAAAMKRRYIAISLGGAVVMLAIAALQYMFYPEMSLIATMYIPLLLLPVQMAAFVPNWRRALRLKADNNWQVPVMLYAETSSSHSRGTLAILPWGWYILSMIIIFVSAAVILSRYPALPDMIPTHFDINMQPDAWSRKSLLTVLMMPLVNLGMLVLMFVSSLTVVLGKLQVSPQNPSLSFAQHRVYRRLMSHAIGFLALSIVVMITLVGMVMVFPEFVVPFWLTMLMIVVPIVPLLWITLRAGQGGCRLTPKITEADELASGIRRKPSPELPGRSDDKFWILGMFYYNPDDPAIIVEDRFGTNLGINYARPFSKIIAVLLLLVVVCTYVWTTVVLLS